MDYIRECFSANLKIRRAMMRISQEKLADLSGVSAGYIANLETGRSFPSTEVLLKLSVALNVAHWKLLADPHKDEIDYSRDELSSILDKVKDYVLGELPSGYSTPKLSSGELAGAENKPGTVNRK
jgi:transcriptional regulator with XRE-family HTH domain